jgi:hypothetical protein
MNIEHVKKITRSAIEDLGLDDRRARAMRRLATLKTAAATKVTDLVIAGVVAYCSARLAAQTDKVAADAVLNLERQGLPRMAIPALFLSDEKALTELLLTSMVVESLAAMGGTEVMVETAQEMIKINMSEGMLDDLGLAEAVRRVVEGEGA